MAGLAYQFVAQLGFVRESWTAPVDVVRVRPAQDTNEVAVEQVKAFLLWSLDKGFAPCSFSTRATPQSSCSGDCREPVPQADQKDCLSPAFSG